MVTPHVSGELPHLRPIPTGGDFGRVALGGAAGDPGTPVPHGKLMQRRSATPSELGVEPRLCDVYDVNEFPDSVRALGPLVDQVTGRALYGKFPSRMQLAPVGEAPSLPTTKSAEFGLYPDDSARKGLLWSCLPITPNISYKLKESLGPTHSKLGDLARDRVVVVPVAAERGQVILQFFVDTDTNVLLGLGNNTTSQGYAALLAALPRAAGQQLLDHFARNPDYVEDFMNLAAPGMTARFDPATNTFTTPGIVRRPPRGAVVVRDIDRGTAACQLLVRLNSDRSSHDARRRTIEALLQQDGTVTRYGRDYSEPYAPGVSHADKQARKRAGR